MVCFFASSLVMLLPVLCKTACCAWGSSAMISLPFTRYAPPCNNSTICFSLFYCLSSLFHCLPVYLCFPRESTPPLSAYRRQSSCFVIYNPIALPCFAIPAASPNGSPAHFDSAAFADGIRNSAEPRHNCPQLLQRRALSARLCIIPHYKYAFHCSLQCHLVQMPDFIHILFYGSV